MLLRRARSESFGIKEKDPNYFTKITEVRSVFMSLKQVQDLNRITKGRKIIIGNAVHVCITQARLVPVSSLHFIRSILPCTVPLPLDFFIQKLADKSTANLFNFAYILHRMLNALFCTTGNSEEEAGSAYWHAGQPRAGSR